MGQLVPVLARSPAGTADLAFLACPRRCQLDCFMRSHHNGRSAAASCAHAFRATRYSDIAREESDRERERGPVVVPREA